MSYNIEIGDEDFGYTSNVSALFYDHMPALTSRGGLHELDGKTGLEALEILSAAFDKIQRASGDMKAFAAMYDAPNGWGSTVGALIFLAKVSAACGMNPEAVLNVTS